MSRLKIAICIITITTFVSAIASERWQQLTTDVMYDATTITTEKDKDGDRITTTWIKYTNQQSQEILIKTIAVCKYRVLNAVSTVTIKKDGTRETSQGARTMDTTPGGPWESTLDAICLKAKPWWQVR